MFLYVMPLLLKSAWVKIIQIRTTTQIKYVFYNNFQWSTEIFTAIYKPQYESLFQKTMEKNYVSFQVSLIAVNILGIEYNEANGESSHNIFEDPDYMSPYDDLAFEMYVDSEVAKIIKDMEVKKHAAVISTTIELFGRIIFSNSFQMRDSNTLGNWRKLWKR